jgi:hypothetical protein
MDHLAGDRVAGDHVEQARPGGDRRRLPDPVPSRPETAVGPPAPPGPGPGGVEQAAADRVGGERVEPPGSLRGERGRAQPVAGRATRQARPHRPAVLEGLVDQAAATVGGEHVQPARSPGGGRRADRVVAQRLGVDRGLVAGEARVAATHPDHVQVGPGAPPWRDRPVVAPRRPAGHAT